MHRLLLFAGFIFIISVLLSISGKTQNVEIAENKNCGNNYKCFSEFFKSRLNNSGIVATLRDLEELSASSPTVKSFCHSFAHEIGREAFQTTSEDYGKIFSEGTTVCWSGFYHGALEVAFEKSSNLAETARSICTEEKGVRGSFLYYQCLHGLGHGLSARFSNEIYGALGVCDKLKDHYEQSSCHGGVFMENYVSDGTNHEPRYLSSEDPIAPCNQVETRYKYPCYQLVSIQILKLNNYNFGKAFKTCEASDPNFVKVCYRSVGRDASGFTSENADQALTYCSEGAKEAEIECVWSVASDSVYSKASVEFVKETCKKAKEYTKTSCYQAVGEGVSLLYPNPEERRSACQKMESSYWETCLQAAGV